MSLALRFPFDGQSVTLGSDGSGSSVTSINSGVGSVTDTTYGLVAYFDGTAHVDLGQDSVPSTVFGSANRSFSVWVNPSSSESTVFSVGEENNSAGLLRVSLNTSRQVIVEYSGLPDSSSTSSLVLGAWSNVLVVYNGTNVQCYINGILNFDDAKSLLTSESSLIIGEGFGGHMSDFRVYNNFLSVQDISDLYDFGPNELLNLNVTDLTVFQDEGLQTDVVVNDGVVAVGNVTTTGLTLIAEKSASGETEVESFVYLHDDTTSERVCISQNIQTVDNEETACTSCLKLCTTDSSGGPVLQSCLQYSGEFCEINSVSPSGDQNISTIDFDGLSFDSDEAAVILGPFSEFRIKYDEGTDTLQIQHLDEGVYRTKVEYGR